MVECFISDAAVARRLRGGPLGPHIDSYITTIDALGFAESTVRTQLWFLSDLGQWLEQQSVPIADLDEQGVEAFLDDRRSRRGGLHRSDVATASRFLGYLRDEKIVVPAEIPVSESASGDLVERFEVYLSRERGLVQVTLDSYRPFVERFLVHCFKDELLHFERIGASDISSFVQRHARSMTPKRAQLMVSALRSFLRFLLQRGEIATDLAACVPGVADRRLSTVPKYLSAEEVERLLSSCDTSTGVGRRDHVILLLLARLGLRAGEVVSMELDDIDWSGGKIAIRGKGLQHDWLPLLPEVGEALATYLRQDRPQVPTRRVFIRVRAPLRGFVGPVAISCIVRRAIQRADLPVLGKGVAAHLFRHSLATGLLREGASMAEIGELLRHRSPATTEIYAKVDVRSLRSLAQPWPGSGGAQ